MKTRARSAEVHDQCKRYQKHRSPSAPQTPKTPDKTKPKQTESIWTSLSIDRSFWDAVKESSAQKHDPIDEKTFDNTNIDDIMSRLNNSISNQFASYKYENFGFLSSSPSGFDPREAQPITDEETEDLQLAIWPTIQHVIELTKHHHIRLPNPKASYLDQVRHVRETLRDTWQDLSLPGNAPPPFQLEAWTGGISNWRSSTYTDGDARIPASAVETQLEIWRAEEAVPKTPTMSNDDDSDISDPEILVAGPEFNHLETSPTVGLSNRRRRRRSPMAALYDSNRDVGFLPIAPQIHAYQSGTTASTTVFPTLSMTDTGLLDDTPELPFPSRRGSRQVVPIFEDNSTSPPSSDAASHQFTHDDTMEDSDKENDPRVFLRQQREERDREETPSSSQNAIDPVGERMVRSELTGLEWEVERYEGWGGGC